VHLLLLELACAVEVGPDVDAAVAIEVELLLHQKARGVAALDVVVDDVGTAVAVEIDLLNQRPVGRTGLLDAAGVGTSAVGGCLGGATGEEDQEEDGAHGVPGGCRRLHLVSSGPPRASAGCGAILPIVVVGSLTLWGTTLSERGRLIIVDDE